MIERPLFILAEASVAAATQTAVLRGPRAPETGPDATTWIALIAGILVIILVLARRRLLNRRKAQNTGTAGSGRLPRVATQRFAGPQSSGERSTAAGASPGDRRQLNDSMQRLMLDLEEMSRQVGGQIDTRLRALNLLIEEADRKIAELRRMGMTCSDKMPPLATPRPGDKSLPAEGGPGDQPARPMATAADDKYARVYNAAARGLSVVEIAREMEIMTGEVELILALRRSAAGRSEGASA